MEKETRTIEAFVEIFDENNSIKYTSNFLSKIDRRLMSDSYRKSYTSKILRRNNKYKENLIFKERDKDDGFVFKKTATITLNFGKPCNISKLYINGDLEKEEYPIDFYVVFKDSLKKAITSFIHQGNSSLEFIRHIEVKDVQYIELAIRRWSHENLQPAITKFYADDKEIYEQKDLLTLECLHEKVNNSEIKYGLNSDFCTIKILNKNRMFDEGKSNDKNYLGRTLLPFVNNTKLGTFYIKEWKVSQDDMYVECKANDILLDFQNITYAGFIPQEQCSFYLAFEKILQVAGETMNFEYKIDDCLKGYSFYPYCKADNIWNILQRLCEASLCHVYVNANNCVIVESELPIRGSTSAYTNDIYVGGRNLDLNNSFMIETIAKPGSLSTISTVKKLRNNVTSDLRGKYRNGTTSFPSIKSPQFTINPSNAFSIDIPKAANMAADVVEIPWYIRKVSEEPETLLEFSKEKGPYRKIGGQITLNDFYTDIKLLNDEDRVNDSQPQFKIKNLTVTFDYEFENFYRTHAKILASKIIFDKHQYMFESEVAKVTLIYKYCHPETELIFGELYAKHLAKAIKKNYPSGTKTTNIKWLGDVNFKINDCFRLTDRFGKQNIYKCTSVKTIIDGGMEQEIKGFLIR